MKDINGNDISIDPTSWSFQPRFLACCTGNPEIDGAQTIKRDPEKEATIRASQKKYALYDKLIVMTEEECQAWIDKNPTVLPKDQIDYAQGILNNKIKHRWSDRGTAPTGPCVDCKTTENVRHVENPYYDFEDNAPKEIDLCGDCHGNRCADT